MLYNINPASWGPYYWKAMHYLTVAYPNNPTESDKEDVKQFFLSVGRVLPCEKCRAHFAKNLQNYPLTETVLSSRYNLVNWLKDIHNEVNTWSGKKQWSYDEVVNEYGDHGKPSCGIEIITISLLILIIVIMIVYFKFLRNKE
jgi:Erv1 / Alr family